MKILPAYWKISLIIFVLNLIGIQRYFSRNFSRGTFSVKISYISYFTIFLLVLSSFSVAFGTAQNYNLEIPGSNLASENFSDSERLAGTLQYESVNFKDKIVVMKNSLILDKQEPVP